MTFKERIARIEKCRLQGLCFISLKQLDVTGKLLSYSLDGHWFENVCIKAQYAPKEA